MNPEEMQQSNMTPDESAAALAFATKLSEGMMPQAPQEPDLPLGEEIMTEEGVDTLVEEEGSPVADLDAKFDTLSEDIKEIKELLKTKDSEESEDLESEK
mgnify:CR=1 FL=1